MEIAGKPPVQPNNASPKTESTSANGAAGKTQDQAIEDMINTVAVNIFAPKMMKRASQTMNKAINGGEGDDEVII